MQLDVGDVVVVPSLGVGVVQSHGPLQVGDDAIPAYRIDLGSDDGAYWIPEAQVGEQGLRAPLDEERIAHLWKTMSSQKAPKKRAHWNQRRRRYDEMLSSNEPTQLAALVGELAAVQATKADKKQVLSFTERRLFDKVKDLLARELAAVTGKAAETMRDDIEQHLEAVA